MPDKAPSTLAQLGLAIGAVAVAIIVRQLLSPWLGTTFPLATMFTAVAFVVWRAGWPPALCVAIGGWVAVGFVFRGVATTVAAISDPHLPGRGWAIFFGVITILAGIVVLAYPFDSLVTLTLVTGIWLIVIGVMEIISSFGIRSDQKKLNEFKGTAAADAAKFRP